MAPSEASSAGCSRIWIALRRAPVDVLGLRAGEEASPADACRVSLLYKQDVVLLIIASAAVLRVSAAQQQLLCKPGATHSGLDGCTNVAQLSAYRFESELV